MILVGHVITELRKLPEKSVHCCVTSPPYWGLRAYGTQPQVWGGDRPCKAHEYVFLLTKHRRYFYDRVAVKEPAAAASAGRQRYGHKHLYGHIVEANSHSDKRTPEQTTSYGADGWNAEFRNLRSVWSLSNQPYKGAHFATFPPKLVIPCIKAGTSEKGCCPVCGAPWRRLTKTNRIATRTGKNSKVNAMILHPDSPYQVHNGTICGNRDPQRHTSQTETIGWEPGCECGICSQCSAIWGAHSSCDCEGCDLNLPDPIPCTVLDPFLGSGTTAAVAEHLGRSWVGTELNEEYAALARERIAVGYHPKETSKARRAKRVMRQLQGLLFE